MMTKLMNFVEGEYSQIVKKAFILITPMLIFNSILVAAASMNNFENKYIQIISLIIYSLLSIVLLINISSEYAKNKSVSIAYILGNGLLMYILIILKFSNNTNHQQLLILIKMATIGIIYATLIPLFVTNVHFVIFKQLSKFNKINVPPAVHAIFKEVITAIIVLLSILVITYFRTEVIWSSFLYLVVTLQKLIAGRLIIVPLFVVLSITIIWFNGLHAMAIINFILRPFWTISIVVNGILVLSNGIFNFEPLIFTEPFFQWFVWIGGTGGTLGLLIAIRLFAKTDNLKELYTVSKISSLFNINETLIYGMPIVKNKIFAIPFILGPIFVTIISYYAISNGLVNEPYLLMPWILPAPVGAFLSTGDLRAVVLTLVNIIILTMLYAPFVIIYERKQTRG